MLVSLTKLAPAPLQYGRVVPPNVALHYSYHTCGNVDKFATTSAIAGRMNGTVMRVSAPEASSPTAHHLAGGLNPRGPMWELINAVARAGSFQLSLQRISQTSVVRRCRLTSG